jgi:hypothetical protein
MDTCIRIHQQRLIRVSLPLLWLDDSPSFWLIVRVLALSSREFPPQHHAQARHALQSAAHTVDKIQTSHRYRVHALELAKHCSHVSHVMHTFLHFSLHHLCPHASGCNTSAATYLSAPRTVKMLSKLLRCDLSCALKFRDGSDCFNIFM